MLCGCSKPGASVCRVAAIEHMCGRRAETMSCPDLPVEREVRTCILEDGATAKRATKQWATRQDIKAGSGNRMW